MISRSQLTLAGRINKTHGIDGEMSVSLFPDLVDDPSDLRCLVMDMDGIFVPFFIESARPRGSEAWLIRLDGVATQDKAASFTGKDVWILNDDVPADEDGDPDGMSAEQLTGYTIIDNGSKIGVITGLNLDTINALFVVERPDGSEILIPIADEFIVDIDPEASTIHTDLPEGLLEIV